MLKAGIIGLPNVGKSSLFSLFTNNEVTIANYPFATIDPNIGVAAIDDSRLNALAQFHNSQKIIPATVKFWDIAGLVQNANEGAGLGNKFLAHIREANALLHVVRAFSGREVTHVHGKIDPLHDFSVVCNELFLADLATLEKRLKIIVKTRTPNSETEAKEIAFLTKIKDLIDRQQPIFGLVLTEQEKEWIQPLNLLSRKKMLVAINVDPVDKKTLAANKSLTQFIEYLKANQIEFVCLAIEYELALQKMTPEDRKNYQKEFGLMGREHLFLIKKTHDLLNLATFFTAGPQESRAWSFVRGTNARNCAGIIHTDFARGFIRCEVVSAANLLIFATEQEARSAGKIASVGQDYEVQDGDVCHFLFS